MPTETVNSDKTEKSGNQPEIWSNAEIEDFLEKPVDFDLLRKKVSEMLSDTG